VPLPDTAHTCSGDEHALLPKLIAGADLPKCRLFKSQGYNSFLDSRFQPVLGDGLSMSNLLKNKISPRIVKFLDSLKAVTAITHDLAGLRYITQLLG
jgi:hypothetical protein